MSCVQAEIDDHCPQSSFTVACKNSSPAPLMLAKFWKCQIRAPSHFTRADVGLDHEALGSSALSILRTA